MNGINQRINKIAIDYFNNNNSKFAKFLGTSEANIRNYRSKTEPRIDVINKIANELEICYEWLLAGEGTMLKPDVTAPPEPMPAPSEPTPLASSPDTIHVYNVYNGLLREKDAVIEKKEAEIKDLRAEIKEQQNDIIRLNRENGQLLGQLQTAKKQTHVYSDEFVVAGG
jgi:transcriptional regulator with XRE-family HTH domain